MIGTPAPHDGDGDRPIAWWAPGRINLIGDHTDYSGGLVLPLAIESGTTATVSLRTDGLLAISSAQQRLGTVHHRLDRLSPNDRDWSCYVQGVAWVLRDQGVDLPGATIAIDGQLPLGAGLSSSAALVCAVMPALLDLSGHRWSRERLVAAARRVENEYVRAPVGVMDPMVVIRARRDHALLIDTRSLQIEHLPLRLSPHSLKLLVFDSHGRHQTAGSAYRRRVDEVSAATQALGVPSLRDVQSSETVEQLSDPILRRRARHVVSENDRVQRAASVLKINQPRKLGPLLTASHHSLRDDFEVSTPALDLIVDTALAAGALGARVTGAGFGGSAIVLLDHGSAAVVTAAVTRAFEDQRWLIPDVSSVTAGRGAHRVVARPHHSEESRGVSK